MLTDPEGNVTEYDYYKDGVGKGLVKSKTLKDGNTVVNTVSYEYNAQLQVSKETTSFDISKNLLFCKRNMSTISSTMLQLLEITEQEAHRRLPLQNMIC